MHYERVRRGTPRLRMEVKDREVTDEAISLLLDFSLQALQRDEHFLVLWDLRQCGIPKTSQIWRCIRWGTTYKAALDERMASLIVLLGAGDLALRGVVQFVMKLTMPAVRPAIVRHCVAV